MLPLWFFAALTASLLSAFGNHMHQRLGGTNTASAVWMKITAVTVCVPMMIMNGIPTEPKFHLFTAIAAAIWCVNDLVYFSAVKKHGAGLLSRLWPAGAVLGFIAWFFVKPDLLGQYLADVPRFAAISAAIALCAFCAFMLQRCALSAAAIKDVWYVIGISVIGIICVKTAIDYAPAEQSVFGYMGIEAMIMLAFYSVYFSIKRRGAFREVISRDGIRTGGLVSLFLVCAGLSRMYAFDTVDHPAFVTAVCMLDVVWLMLLTRLAGWEDKSNKWAGLGIVAATVALAFLKIR